MRSHPARAAEQFEFLTHADAGAGAGALRARHRRHAAHALGVDGRVRRGHVGGQPRVGRREAARLLQAQARLVRDAAGRRPAAARSRCSSSAPARSCRPTGSRTSSYSVPWLQVVQRLRLPSPRDADVHPRRRASSTTSPRTRRCACATSGSAPSSPACCGASPSGLRWYLRGTRLSVHGRSAPWSASSSGCTLGGHSAVRLRSHGRVRPAAENTCHSRRRRRPHGRSARAVKRLGVWRPEVRGSGDLSTGLNT